MASPNPRSPSRYTKAGEPSRAMQRQARSDLARSAGEKNPAPGGDFDPGYGANRGLLGGFREAMKGKRK